MEISQYLVIASCASVLIGMSKGGLPLVAMMSVPLLSLVMSPLKAVVLLLPVYIISDVVSVWLYRRSFSLINLKILVPASMVGILIAWFTASTISDLTIKLIIGLVGVSFCLQVYLLPQKLPKAEFAGTATILFAIINLAKIGPYQNLSPYSWDDLMEALVLVPFALIGTFLGAYLTQRIADAWFFKLVQGGLLLVSLKLISDAVRG